MAEQSELKVVISGEDKFTPVVQRFESSIIRSVGAISSAIATLSTLAFPVTQAANLEREMANVSKTTNFTAQQIANLTKELAELSTHTNTSAVDLAKIAAAAGQQGLGKQGVEGIRQFTESVARMASVLDLTAEDAGRNIGKILNVFQIPLKDVENVVSSINQVTNQSTARANELINVLKRLGDAGGSLKFTQSVALGAAALDLGATPEVAGTTLAKLESALKVRNKEIATLLNKSRKEVAKAAADDGFNLLLEVLTKLADESQTIREAEVSKLFGGGRITSLVDKLTSDLLKNAPIVLRELQQADQGFASGTSAIKEQQTVLGTFKEQVVVLKNALAELGRQAGQDLLAPLTGYVVQLRRALSDPGVQGFVTSVVHAFGDLIGVIVNVTKAVGNLGINWENFIKVLEVVAFVKVFEAMKRLAGTLPGLTSGFTLLGVGMQKAVETDATGAEKQVSAWGALKASVAQATAALRGYSEERTRVAALDAEATAKQQAAHQAADRAALLAQDAQVKNLQAKVAANNLSNAEAAVKKAAGSGDQAIINANAIGQQAVLNAQRVGQAKMEAAELAHNARMAEIQVEFAGARSATERAMRDTIIADEEKFFTRQMAALRTADAKRIAQAEEAATALVAITAARAKQELIIEEEKAAKLAAVANAANTTAATATAAHGVANTGAGTAGAEAAAAAAVAQVASEQQAGRVSRMGALLKGLGAAFGLLGTAISFVVKAAVPFVFWATAIFSLLDAFGVFDKLAPMFTKLADAIGLSTEASRKDAEQKKEQHAKALQEIKDLDDLIDRYKSLKDVKTGALNVGEVSKLKTDLTNARTSQDFSAVTDKISLALSGNEAEQTKAKKQLDSLPSEYAKVVDQIKAKVEELAKLRARLADGGTSPTSATGEVDIGQAGLESAIDKADAELKKLQERLGAVNPAIAAEAKKSMEKSLADAETLRDLTTGIFTDRARQVLVESGEEVSALRQKYDDLKKARQKQSDDALSIEGTEARARAQNEVKVLGEQMDAVTLQIGQKLDQVRKLIKDAATDPSIAQLNKNSLEAVLNLLDGPKAKLDAFVKESKNTLKAAAEGTTQLRANAGNLVGNLGTKPPEGNNNSGLAGIDGEERKRIKAIAELEKAQAQARIELQKEANKELLDENQNMYNHGLESLEQYYANKHALDEANLENEIGLVQQEIDIKQKERKQNDLQQSDRIRIDAEIVNLKAKKGVLEAQVADLPRQIGNETENALKQFQETVLQSQIEMMDVFGMTDFHVKFETELKLAELQFKDTIAKMRASIGKNGVTKELVDQLELQLTAKAVEKTFSAIADKTALATADLDRYISRIALLNQQGKLTDIDAETLTNRARARIAEEVKKEIKSMTAELDELRRKGETMASSDAYRRLAEQIEKAKDRFIELKQAADATARAINSAVESSLTDAFKQLSQGDKKTQQQLLDEAARLKAAQQPGYKTQQDVFVVENMKTGVQKALETFSTGITSSIRDVLAKDLSQTVIKAFGGGGTGGLGGLISSILHPGEQQAREKETIGLTEANAMYVELTSASKEALKPIPPVVSPGGAFNPNDEFANRTVKGINVNEDGTDDSVKNDIKQKGELLLADVGTTAGKILTTVGGLMGGKTGGALFVFGTFFSKFKKIFTDETNGLTKELDGGGLGIGELFKSLSSGISKIFESISSMFGGSEGGGIASIFASFFHDGGLVGAGGGEMRAFPTSVFQNAMRYHGGGSIGLRPDEVPAILQKGEVVLSRSQVGGIANGGSSSLHPASSAAPQPVQLSIHPDAINMTLREWLENEMARIHANR